jgi:hypothetical protein
VPRLENTYKASLCKRIEREFPGAVILKNDAGYLQGVPDRTVLLGRRWGMLEIKIDIDAPIQPNQPYYVDMFNEMSFASFLYPENEEEILYELGQALRP